MENTYIKYNTLLNDVYKMVAFHIRILITITNYFISRIMYPLYIQLTYMKNYHIDDQNNK